jgi:hypothetical protein
MVGGGVICGAVSTSPGGHPSFVRTLGYFDRVQIGNMANDDIAAWSPRQVITTCGSRGRDTLLCGMYPVEPCATLPFAMSRTALAQHYVTYHVVPSTFYDLRSTALVNWPGTTIESSDNDAIASFNCHWGTCLIAAANDAAFSRLYLYHGQPGLFVRSSMNLITVDQCIFEEGRDGSVRQGAGITVSFGSEIYIRGSIFRGMRADGDGAGIFSSYAFVYLDDSTFYNCTSGSNGAAVYAYASTTRLRGVNITRMVAINGGGVSQERGFLSALSSVFYDCRASLSGGAIFMKALSTYFLSSMDTCTVSKNQASFGGGIAIENSQVQMNRMVFFDNVAQDDKTSSGGAIRINDGRVNISESTFDRNKHLMGLAPEDQLSRGGGAIACASQSYPRLTWLIISNCIFTNGASVHKGGVLRIDRCPLQVDQTLFGWNQAALMGGVVSMEDTLSVSITRCTFLSNWAGDGGVFASLGSPALISWCIFNGNQAYRGGACMFTQERPPVITNSTFINNIASYGINDEYASPPSGMIVISPPQGSNHTSGEEMDPPVSIALIDDYGRVVTSENSLQASATTLLPLILGGSLNTYASKGYFNFNGTGSSLVMVGRGAQGYRIRFYTIVQRLRGGPVYAYDYLQVGIRLCQPGEYQAIDRCVPCAAGWYSDTVNVTECQRCPAG